jgi:hypothetical protein
MNGLEYRKALDFNCRKGYLGRTARIGITRVFLKRMNVPEDSCRFLTI